MNFNNFFYKLPLVIAAVVFAARGQYDMALYCVAGIYLVDGVDLFFN